MRFLIQLTGAVALSALFLACTPPDRKTIEDNYVPAGYEEKSPRLPTLFVDTTGKTYAWHKAYNTVQSIQNRIQPPKGFVRKPVESGSFAEWLRLLPLKPGKPDVKLFDGSLKSFQGAHFRVIDMDVGKRDLQQCADAVMRLRAEYLYTKGDFNKIHFNFTSGDECAWNKWRQGYRPLISGNNVSWSQTALASDSYSNFRSYLTKVFNYAGTSSLAKEMDPVSSVREMKIGDVFIWGGFPGHAIMVMDIAEDEQTGQKAFLLAQSYMPAQEMHILVNDQMNPELNPWYLADFSGDLQTPEWSFSQSALSRFRN